MLVVGVWNGCNMALVALQVASLSVQLSPRLPWPWCQLSRQLWCQEYVRKYGNVLASRWGWWFTTWPIGRIRYSSVCGTAVMKWSSSKLLLCWFHGKLDNVSSVSGATQPSQWPGPWCGWGCYCCCHPWAWNPARHHRQFLPSDCAWRNPSCPCNRWTQSSSLESMKTNHSHLHYHHHPPNHCLPSPHLQHAVSSLTACPDSAMIWLSVVAMAAARSIAIARIASLH